MTDYPIDARPSCMVAALDTLRAAQKLKLEPGKNGRVREHLPELYWSLMTEAAIYAELAKAPDVVGIAAGSHMTARDEGIRERRTRIRRDVQAKLNEVRNRGGKHPNTAADPFEAANGGAYPVRVIVTNPNSTHRDRTGIILQNRLSADREPSYLVSMLPGTTDQDGPREAEHVWFDRSELDLVVG